MAAVQALRTALNRLGLSIDAANYATDELGLDTLNRWRDFHTDMDLDGLAKNLRNPGGMIDAPGAVQGAPQIRHPGFPVSVHAISNIYVLRVVLKHFQHIQRVVVAPTITEEWIEEWKFLVDFYKDVSKKKSVDEDLPKITMSDWAKTKEKIINHFSEVYSKEGIPLAYLLREEVEVPQEADDPQDDYEDDHVKELIARAAHTGAHYRADNRRLCRDLKKLCADTPAYTHISKYTADGRQAWLDLMDAYLGPQHTQLQAAIYEAKLQKSTYDGESNRFTFDKYAEIHNLAHSRLDSLPDYAGMDEGTKIRHLLNGIKTDKLKTVIELVRGNSDFDTFDKVVRRLKDSVVTLAPTKAPSRQVSAVTVMGGNGEEIMPNVDADLSVEDKYYQPQEWAKLSNAKKKGVLYKRAKRGRAPGKGKDPKKDPKNKAPPASNKQFQKLSKQVKALTRKVASVSIEEEADSQSSGSDSDVEPPKKKKKKSSNRAHPALNRR